MTLFILPSCYKWLSAVQDLDEGLAKLDVEGGVDDGVDGAVQVAQPGHGAVKRGRDAAAAAVGLEHVGEKEGKPANDEHAWGRRHRQEVDWRMEGERSEKKNRPIRVMLHLPFVAGVAL